MKKSLLFLLMIIACVTALSAVDFNVYQPPNVIDDVVTTTPVTDIDESQATVESTYDVSENAKAREEAESILANVTESSATTISALNAFRYTSTVNENAMRGANKSILNVNESSANLTSAFITAATVNQNTPEEKVFIITPANQHAATFGVMISQVPVTDLAYSVTEITSTTNAKLERQSSMKEATEMMTETFTPVVNDDSGGTTLTIAKSPQICTSGGICSILVAENDAGYEMDVKTAVTVAGSESPV
jgi:hypothetical protein